MATATWSVNHEISTDAKFRALFAPVSAALAAAGWTLVTQVFASGSDWTTVTAPSSDVTARVTEVWAMADALQSTSPFFLKIEYGRDSTTRPAINLTLGTGASSTTILGTLYTTPSWLECPLIANAVSHYASGNTSRFMVAFCVNGTGTGTGFYMGFCLQRRNDGVGADAATGFLMNTWRQSAAAFFDSRAGTATVSQGTVPATAAYCASSAGQLTFGGDVCVAPVIYCLGPGEFGMSMVGVPSGSYSPGQTFTVTLFGVSCTFLCLQTSPALQEPAGQTLLRAAVRYD